MKWCLHVIYKRLVCVVICGSCSYSFRLKFNVFKMLTLALEWCVAFILWSLMLYSLADKRIVKSFVGAMLIHCISKLQVKRPLTFYWQRAMLTDSEWLFSPNNRACWEREFPRNGLLYILRYIINACFNVWRIMRLFRQRDEPYIHGKGILCWSTEVKHAIDYATEWSDRSGCSGAVCTCVLSLSISSHRT